MGKGPKWSPEERKFFKEAVKNGMTDEQISSEFHVKTKFEKAKGFHMRSPDAMGRRRRLLELEQPKKVGKLPNHQKPWAPADDNLLLNYDEIGVHKTEMSKIFGRTEVAIENRLRYLKSKESDSWLGTVKGYFIHIFRRFGHEI